MMEIKSPAFYCAEKWGRERARPNERVCVCVCERERERESKKIWCHILNEQLF